MFKGESIGEMIRYTFSEWTYTAFHGTWAKAEYRWWYLLSFILWIFMIIFAVLLFASMPFVTLTGLKATFRIVSACICAALVILVPVAQWAMYYL